MNRPEPTVRSSGLWLLPLAVAAWAAPPQDAASWLNQAPVVQVVVFFDADLGYQAVVAYDRNVPRAEIKQQLTVLAHGLGYGALDDLRRSKPDSDGKLPLGIEDSRAGSQVSFRLSERAFNRSIGTFKLEPFIDAFKAYRRIDLDFAVGPLQGQQFIYHGLRDYEDGQVILKFHSGPSYSFRIGVKDPAYTTLKLPPFAPPTEPLRKVASDRKESPWRWQTPLAVVAAIAVGWLTFAAVLRMLKASGRPR